MMCRPRLGHELLFALEVGLEVLRLEPVRVVDVPRHLPRRRRRRRRRRQPFFFCVSSFPLF